VPDIKEFHVSFLHFGGDRSPASSMTRTTQCGE